MALPNMIRVMVLAPKSWSENSRRVYTKLSFDSSLSVDIREIPDDRKNLKSAAAGVNRAYKTIPRGTPIGLHDGDYDYVLILDARYRSSVFYTLPHLALEDTEALKKSVAEDTVIITGREAGGRPNFSETIKNMKVHSYEFDAIVKLKKGN